MIQFHIFYITSILFLAESLNIIYRTKKSILNDWTNELIRYDDANYW